MESGAPLPERHRPPGAPHSRGPAAPARCPLAAPLRDLVSSLLPRLAEELQLGEAAAHTAMLAAYAVVGLPRTRPTDEWLELLYGQALAEARGRRVMEAVYGPALWGARDDAADEGTAEDAAMEQLVCNLEGRHPEVRCPAAYHRRGARFRARTERRTGLRRGQLVLGRAHAPLDLDGAAGFGGQAPADALERLVREGTPEHALACRVVEALREGLEERRVLAAREVCAARGCKDAGAMIAALLRVDLPGEASQAELAALAGVKPETFSRYSTPYRARLRELAAELLQEVLAEEELELASPAGVAARQVVEELGVSLPA